MLAHADLAANYWSVEEQKQVFDATLVAWKSYLDLTQGLYKSGLEADKAQAEAEPQFVAAQAQDTNLGIARAQYEHAIAILIGESPSAFTLSAASKDVHLSIISVGISAELLRRDQISQRSVRWQSPLLRSA